MPYTLRAPIPGFEGTYRATTAGRIESRKWGRWRRLKTYRDRAGYGVVGLANGGRAKKVKVGRLVLLAFVGPCPAGKELAHGPAGKGDDSLANVSWKTHAENLADRHRDGTMTAGERHWNAQLSADDVRDIRRRRAAGERAALIAAEHSVTTATVYDVAGRRSWRHLVD